MSFEALGLNPAILSSILEAGFTAPTPVQEQSIPLAIAGHDLMVSAQTGSGKTAAFMLPALNRQVEGSPLRATGVRVLVLTPTRELAQQVSDATRVYGKNLNWLRTATVVGGMPYGAQIRSLARRVDVLVATPGRLLDHVNAGRVNLSEVETLVLDEADRMLDMGFIDDIEAIVARTPATRQTLLFSATLDGTIAKLAARMMRDPKRVEVSNQKENHANITQTLLYADDMGHKSRLLDHLLRDVAVQQAIVFTSTKRAADELANTLADGGFSSAALHGDMNQRQRTRTLSMMQRGQVQILVATDVAARGIDVQGISHVINFDLPMQAEDYVHRIGRTGRAGRDGLAFTLATHSERHKVRTIERYTEQSINVQTIAGLEPQRAPRPGTSDRSGSGPRGGARPGFRSAGGYSRDGAAPRTGGGYRGEGRPAPGFAGRDGAAPRPQGDRPWGDRPARPAGTWADRPARPAGDRPQAARTWGDRPAGDRPARPEGTAPRRFDSRRKVA
jgi:superfamily II DNA/RNA helicase